jgi:DNA anti-recombination protein RmuC
MKPLLSLLATLPLLAACGQESQAGAGSNPNDLSSKASAAAQQAKSSIASGVAEFQKSSSDALAAIDQKLDVLKSKASSASESAKAEMDEAIANLNEQRKKLGEKLAELKAEAPEKAQAMIDKLKSDLAALKKSAEDAAARFK